MRRAKLGVATFLACLAGFWFPALAQEPTVPVPRGFVNDYAGVLDAGTEAYLESAIAELRRKTGAEIAVVTVRTTRPLGAFDYAMKIAETWRPGSRERDNGIVFLVAVDDREMFILTGYGVEGALPDGLVGEIRDTLILPRFRQGDYAGGVRAGVDAILGILAREYGVELGGGGGASLPPARRRPASPLLALLPFLILFLFLGLFGRRALFAPYSRRRYAHPLFWGSFGGGGFGGGFGRGFGGGGGGGFGGFGGGGFGGGGAGGSW